MKIRPSEIEQESNLIVFNITVLLPTNYKTFLIAENFYELNYPKVNVRTISAVYPNTLYFCMGVGMRELCWNNFRNNDRVKESRIIPEF